MTELRLALAVVGLVLVVAVALISYDKFRLRRVLRRREEFDSTDPDDSEPMLARRVELDLPAARGDEDDRVILLTSKDEVPVPDARVRLRTDIEELEEEVSRPVNVEVPQREQPPEQKPDERIDFVANINGEKVVARDSVLGIYRQHEYLIERAHRIFGRRSGSGLWRELDREPASGTYGDIALSIQLVDSRGPVTESDLNRFAQLGLRLADALERPLKFNLSFEEALARARELEKFCEQFDLLAIINIVSRSEEGFAGRDIERAAAAAGLELGQMNIFHRRNPAGNGCPNLFSLANMLKPGEFRPDELDTLRTRGLSLFMNVPCTPDPIRVFREMSDAAQLLCDQLDGELRDSQHKPLSADQLKGISKVIEKSVAGMHKAGIEPGSPLATRLF